LPATGVQAPQGGSIALKIGPQKSIDVCTPDDSERAGVDFVDRARGGGNGVDGGPVIAREHKGRVGVEVNMAHERKGGQVHNGDGTPRLIRDEGKHGNRPLVPGAAGECQPGRK
jgi:hypothetical protein